MSRVGSQRQRLLTWAQRGGPIRQTDWAANAPDGGDPILRVAAVVGALERRGHRFEHRRLGNGTTEYRLRREIKSDAHGANGEQIALPVAQEAIYR